ncbi:hypothetical protein Salat_2900700 [Sesamum alatum]|uniref:Uncharacterized protein n=1 Tax=Sesamum alatum TaxID=300844 RepID=A0AAE2C853_9LAMI|nr:hypothetical protein Salat_2900700 [Sesamum alatum]
MWPDGFYYQQHDFYCSRWSKDMERTFVHSLIDLCKAGIFRRGEENLDAICSALEAEKKKTKWYINAYEELCMLFGDRDDEANTDAVPQPIDLNAPPPADFIGHVSPPKNVDKSGHSDIVFISDSSDSSSSLWGYIDELLGSGSDADSVLPPPGVPASISKKKTVMPQSPPSFHSVEGNSSSASNPTPKKNVT